MHDVRDNGNERSASEETKKPQKNNDLNRIIKMLCITVKKNFLMNAKCDNIEQIVIVQRRNVND